jgi:catechol 2,3-dioxygenase-like lactoylglutathione lyase family enzyme
MSWSLDHLTVQANELGESARFYAELLGLGPPGRELDFTAQFFDASSRALHLIRPDPGYGAARGLHVNPMVGGHLALHVDDLEAIVRRLEGRGWAYSRLANPSDGPRLVVFVRDPSRNVVELTQRS